MLYASFGMSFFLYVIFIQYFTGTLYVELWMTPSYENLNSIKATIRNTDSISRSSFILVHTSYTNSLFLIPHLLASDPRTKNTPAAIKNDQVRIRTRPKRALARLNTKALRWIERHTLDPLAQRTPREPREVADATVKGDHAASEGVGALEIQLSAFLHETLSVAPLVYSVFQMWVQDFHG